MTLFTLRSALGAGPPASRVAAAACTATPAPAALVGRPGNLHLPGYVVIAAGKACGAPTSWDAGKGTRAWSG
jgi:hypothetical protein